MSPFLDEESADELAGSPDEEEVLAYHPSSPPLLVPVNIQYGPDRGPRNPSVGFSIASSESSDDSQPNATEPLSCTLTKQDPLVSVDLPPSTLSIPSSMYKIYDPKTELCKKANVPIPEARALDDLERQAQLESKNNAHDDDDEDEFYLDNFAFYTLSSVHRYELCGLQDMFKVGNTTLYFNGWLSRGNGKSGFYLESRPFQRCSIGNYSLEAPSIDGAVWIQSKQQGHKKAGAWYRLRNPGFEYVRLYRPFLWLADLAKHVINFIEDKISKKIAPSKIGIHSFTSDFASWLDHVHGTSPAFKAWFDQHSNPDFRSDVAVHAEFLWKEANGTLQPKVCQNLRLFKEVLTLTQHRKHETKDNMTVVTPYVYDLFRHMECGHLLKRIPPTGMQQTAPYRRNDTGHAAPDRKNLIADIRVGDVISRKPDGAGSKWKDNQSTKWFGLVQQIVEPSQGETKYHIKWLYSPLDTPCNRGTYPWKNELFLSSNHCSCHRQGDAPFLASEILAKHSVAWFGDENTTEEYFVRQSYDNEERRWVTLQKSQMFCKGAASTQSVQYSVGETVLADGASRLEPYVIISGNLRVVNVRKLLRRSELDPASSAPQNELVYTEEVVQLPVNNIRGPCTVRIFTGNPQIISTPYDRRGTGNCFFIRFKLEVGFGLVEMMKVPPMFKQGFLPQRQNKNKQTSTPRPLRGLDLFSGCGNLGRGIEESGAVEVKWVNDIWSPAIHTYMANIKNQNAVKPFLGSVDLLLEKALTKDTKDGSIPSPGEVEFISGGSPCQGFSLLTVNKSHDSQKKNRSLIASFASFVDFYRPKFGLLENVTNMVNANVGPDCDYLSQLFCALVGLGYQVQIILGDAWAYGAPQQRSRIFLSFARSDCRLPKEPARSHSHPVGIPTRGIGYLSNGERFVKRQFSSTAFHHVTSGEAIDDLPKIGDGKQICIPFADHRSSNESFASQIRIAHIPVAPYGIGFIKAYETGRITEAERNVFPASTLRAERTRTGRGWTRLPPNKLFPTITTTPNHTDSRTGCQIHPYEQRTLTVMEIRRAQGVPDNDVLIGNFRERWKLVGNSVARQAALALGLELRRAYYGNLYDDNDEDAAAQAIVLSDEDSQKPLHRIVKTEPKQAASTTTMANSTLERGSHRLSAAVAITPDGARLSAQVQSNSMRATATATIDLTTTDVRATTAIDLNIDDDAFDARSSSSSQWKRKLDIMFMDSNDESESGRAHSLKVSRLSGSSVM